MSELRQKTFSGSLLLGGAQIGLRVIATVSTIILARLLDPADFGLVGLAQIALTTAGVLVGLGMGAALIQSQREQDRVAFHAAMITGVSGVTIGCVVALAAEPISALLGEARLVPILRWMSLLLPLTALSTVPEALMQKGLQFGRVSVVVIAGELAYMVFALVCAFGGLGVWSLVVGSLGKALLVLGLMWSVLPSRRWVKFQRWDWEIAGDLLQFGLRTTGSGFTTFLYQMVDNLVVGRKLGAAALGFYGKAMDFTSRTVDGFSNIIGTVLFASFSTIQNDRERLSRVYLKSLKVTSFVTVPLAAGIFVTAPELISVLLGEKWTPMVPALQILAFVSMVKPLSGSTAALFFAVGKPGYSMRAGAIVFSALLIMIYVLLPWGFPGVALAVFIAHLVGFLYNVRWANRVLPGAALKMFQAIGPALAASGLMVVVLTAAKIPLRWLCGGEFNLVALGGLVVLGVVVYGGFLLLTQRETVVEVALLIRERISSRSDAPPSAA